MNSFRRNIPVLATSQALMMSSMTLILTTAALVGFSLAPDQKYATLPVAVIYIAVMCTSIPASLLMERIGRKRGFLFATSFGFSGSALAMYAILNSNFWLFVVSMFLIGMFNGFGNYFRFAAADAVTTDLKSKAISYVLAGGVIAAIVGPNLASLTRDSFENAPFAASYAALMIMYLLIFVSLLFLKLPDQTNVHHENSSENKTIRPLKEIVLQKKFVVAVVVGMFGYGVMTFIMTATPLAMQHHHHDFSDVSFTIQWHVLGMYIPSFFTGHLINRFGLIRIMFIGAIIGLGSITVSLLGTSVIHYWFALVLLGIGWNFMFIGATTLLTETYSITEKGKTQAVNDFIIFTTMTFASLSAGALQYQFGWQAVNYGAIPFMVIVIISLIWLQRDKSKTINNCEICEETIN
ncbi:MAG: MFS transporter [Thiohalomonadales bacterium]